MNIFEYATCEYCEKSYRGKFKLLENGKVKCFDCDNPLKLPDLSWKQVNRDEEKVQEELVKDLMKKDLRRIYIPRAEAGKEEGSFLRGEDGKINPKVIYFQNNPMDLVTEAHRATYIALQYSESGLTKHADKAEEMVTMYLSLREKKISEDEQKSLWKLIYSEELYEMDMEVQKQ